MQSNLNDDRILAVTGLHECGALICDYGHE